MQGPGTHADVFFRVLRAAAIVALVLLGSCSKGEKVDSEGAGVVAVSVAPLLWIAQGLVPDGVRVVLATPVGASPHHYEPTPRALASFVGADVVLLIDEHFEPGLGRVLSAHPRAHREVVSFSEVMSGAHSGSDGHDLRAQEHGGDMHYWLDPCAVEAFVRAAAVAIGSRCAHNDGERAQIESSRDELIAQIHETESWCADRLRAHEGGALVTEHDAFGRFADRFGLRIAAVIRPIEGQEPTPGSLHKAVVAIRQENVPVVITEPQFSKGAAERVAASAGIPTLELDPIGDGDWPALMRGIAEGIARAFEEAEDGGDDG